MIHLHPPKLQLLSDMRKERQAKMGVNSDKGKPKRGDVTVKISIGCGIPSTSQEKKKKRLYNDPTKHICGLEMKYK